MRNHRIDLCRLCRWPCIVGYCILAMSVPVSAAGNEKRTDTDVSAVGYVQDYLSDRRRAGSLVGSVLGGALTAHPLGPVLGSVFGFLIGKTTMHEASGAMAPATDVGIDPRRAIVPSNGATAAAVSFDQGGAVSFDSKPAQMMVPETALVSVPQSVQFAGPAAGAQHAVGKVTPFGLAATPASALQRREQIALLCSDASGQVSDPRLRNVCFYFRGN